MNTETYILFSLYLIQSTLVIAARFITANLVNGKKIMGTNQHQR